MTSSLEQSRKSLRVLGKFFRCLWGAPLRNSFSDSALLFQVFEGEKLT